VPPNKVVKIVESAKRISPPRVPFGGIQMNELNSRFPAAVNGCGRDRSTGCLAKTWMDFVSSVVSAWCGRCKRCQDRARALAVEPFSDGVGFPLLGDEVVQAENHQRVRVCKNSLIDRERVPCLVDALVNGHWSREHPDKPRSCEKEGRALLAYSGLQD
jgi:hypothetical protein